MSQSEKAAYFRALKEAGVEFVKHYREYSTAELKEAHDKLVAAGAAQPVQLEAEQPPATEQSIFPPARTAPVAQRDPNEMPGARLNTQPADEPIRTDENGLVWYQEEVLKPGYAKPRGRRVLQYTDRGTTTQSVQDGQFMESFEVAGSGPAQVGEIKITLPSYQTGIYKDPRYPFKIHTYNGVKGFDFAEVARYYGGMDLVPETIKRTYVENVLCYDIRTTIRTIQNEYRQLQLAGKV